METPALRGHQISFAIAREHRAAVSEWLTETRGFFAAAVSTLNAQKQQAAGAPRPAAPGSARRAPGLPTFHELGVRGATELNILQAEDVLEGITVQYAVQLIANLNHRYENVRLYAVHLLCRLARIFDRALVDSGKKKIERLTHAFQTDDKGYHSSVHELFHIIGPAFASMAVAIVAGLEFFYSCADPVIRGICITALSRLIFENERVFLEEDRLAAMWNLFFLLNSPPLMAKFFVDRIVIIKGLGLLAPLYAASDVQLTLRIIDSLLRLPTKTATELETIKTTLKKIFDRLVELFQSKKDGAARMMYELFLELLLPNDEAAYDLLPWALEMYTSSLYAAPSSAGRKHTPNRDYPLLVDFVKSLSNHYRAPPALIRYGAHVCLYTAQKLSPTILADQKVLMIHAIMGALDTDYLSAALCLSRFETLKPPGSAANLKKIIADYRHLDYQNQTYDSKYAFVDEVNGNQVKLTDIMDVAVLASPPLPQKMLQKLANSLEYLMTSQKLRQLQQIRVWASRTEQFDTFLMQSLVPLFVDHEEEIQMAAIGALQRLGPTFRSASPAEFSFFWSHIRVILLDNGIRPRLLEAILTMMSSMPLQMLSADSRSELVCALFKLVFNPDISLRVQVYKLIGSIPDIWKGDEVLSNLSYALLLTCTGEQNRKALEVLVSQLMRLEKTPYRQLVPWVIAVSQAAKGTNLRAVIKAYDDLAEALHANADALAGLCGTLTSYAYADEWWNFFNSEVPENQLVDPDEYFFSRNFVHSPFWTSLLYSKLAVVPPPGAGQDASKRTVKPTTPAGRRRYLCGFMLSSFPTTGIPDPNLRKAAALTCVRCCFKRNALTVPVTRSLLEYVTQQMLTHRHWTYKLSGMEIIGCFIRLKLPQLSQALLLQHAQLAVDFGYNTPSSMIKIGILEFVETLLLIFPSGIMTKLQDIRDMVRHLIVDKDPEVAAQACEVYPLVFYTAANTNPDAYFQYLQNELNTLEKGGLKVAGDPLVSKLTEAEMARVVRMSILCMGALKQKSVAFGIVQELLPYLKSRSRSLRRAAISTILEASGVLDPLQRSITMWITLPLAADPCIMIRDVWNRFQKRLPSKADVVRRSLPPHPDDSHLINSAPWEEVLAADDNCILSNAKNFTDALLENISGRILESTVNAPVPDDENLHLPTVSPRLIAKIKSLVTNVECGFIPQQNVNEIIYFLQELRKNVHSECACILVLSEFCNLHEGTINDVIDIFLSHIAVEQVTSDTSRMMEACMLALRNCSDNSPATFKMILNKITAPTIPTEGDLIALYYLSDYIKDVCPSKAPEILRKYLPIITSQRHSTQKRLWASFLSVEMSLIAGPDEMARVLDGVQSFIETIDDEEIKVKVYAPLGKILGQLGPKHALFKSMLANAKKQIYNKNANIRKKSLPVFRVFARYLSAEEAMWFGFLYLSDPDPDVREKGRSVMIYESLLDFISEGTTASTSPDLNEETIALAGSAAPKDHEDVLIIPLPARDNFNVKYYSSARRRKFTERYGLPETLFAGHQQPLTLGLLDLLNEKIDFEKISSEAKTEELMSLSTSVILHECMVKYPAPAVDLIETVLVNVDDLQASLAEKEEEEGKEDELLDVESELHALEVLSRLVAAYDGVGDEIDGWMSRIEVFISQCCASSAGLREVLYKDMEATFFFYNDYVDIPIISEDQYEALKNLRAQAQEAVSDMVRAGALDKLTRHESRISEMNDDIDHKSEYLRRFTIMVIHATAGYGRFYSSSTYQTESQLVRAFKFLVGLLENEHRGVRSMAVNSLLNLAKAQLSKTPQKQMFLEENQALIQSFWKRLVNERETMFRKKADAVTLICPLLIFVPDKQVRTEILKLLIELWRDADSEIRIISIGMVQYLAEAGVREVVDAFIEKETRGEASEINIMKEIASLMGNPEYMEKEQLNELLKWFFTSVATSGK